MPELSCEIIESVVFGHAVGDALGVPVQFFSREKRDQDPVSEMRSFGVYPFPAGAWSDDTSMALCALDSLARGQVWFDEVMANFGRWYYKDEFTPTGKMFDVGGTCAEAINNYFIGHKSVYECGPADERANGNGSLMRIYPFILFSIFRDGELDTELIASASALTHTHSRAKLGCCIYAYVLVELLNTPSKAAVYSGLEKAKIRLSNDPEFSHYRRIFSEGFSELLRDEIKSSGYVVDTLEAALWCLVTTGSYRDCVLKAVNLGGDTDTIAAVAGSLAGALYGIDAIPPEWLDILIRREYIEALCEKTYDKWRATFAHKRNNRREWLIRVPLTVETLADVPLGKVTFYASAAPGAMGVGCRLSLYAKDGDKLAEYRGSKYETVLKEWLEGALFKSSDEWADSYLGFGNYLYLKKEYLEKYLRETAEMSPGRMYKLLPELIMRVVSGE